MNVASRCCVNGEFQQKFAHEPRRIFTIPCNNSAWIRRHPGSKTQQELVSAQTAATDSRLSSLFSSLITCVWCWIPLDRKSGTTDATTDNFPLLCEKTELARMSKVPSFAALRLGRNKATGFSQNFVLSEKLELRKNPACVAKHRRYWELCKRSCVRRERMCSMHSVRNESALQPTSNSPFPNPLQTPIFEGVLRRVICAYLAARVKFAGVEPFMGSHSKSAQSSGRGGCTENTRFPPRESLCGNLSHSEKGTGYLWGRVHTACVKSVCPCGWVGSRKVRHALRPCYAWLAEFTVFASDVVLSTDLGYKLETTDIAFSLSASSVACLQTPCKVKLRQTRSKWGILPAMTSIFPAQLNGHCQTSPWTLCCFVESPHKSTRHSLTHSDTRDAPRVRRAQRSPCLPSFSLTTKVAIMRRISQWRRATLCGVGPAESGEMSGMWCW